MNRRQHLDPCENCGGPLGTVYTVLRCSLALLQPDGAVNIVGDEVKELQHEFAICIDCHTSAPLHLGQLAAKHAAKVVRESALNG